MALIIMADDTAYHVVDEIAKGLIDKGEKMIGVPDLAKAKGVSNQHIIQLYKIEERRKIDPADLVQPACSRYAFLPYEKYINLAIGNSRAAKPEKKKKRKPKNTVIVKKKKE